MHKYFYFLVIFSFFFTGISAFAQQKDPDIIRDLEEKERLAILKGDIPQISLLLSKKIVVQNPENMIVGFDQIIDRVKNGKINYAVFERRIDSISFAENMAIVMGLETLVPQGETLYAGNTIQRRFTNIWTVEQGQWKLIARQASIVDHGTIKTGADQTELYVPYLKGKRVAMLANQTSVINKTHLVDSLRSLGVRIVKVFGPEHGFRGNASAGVKVADETDPVTGIPVISLYGKKNKPTKEDLDDVDILIYDLQDVGCRFYTNINALARLMEACAEHGKELMILDRPNPNGYLIDGPILDMQFKSGIGMFPLPISHGLTVAEFAQMANGEGWLTNKVKCSLRIIKVANYNHDMPYVLPVSPSPNLNTQQAVMLYPSTCLFEGVYVNHGRGTCYPFTLIGSPELKGKYDFNYIPTGIPGMAETPLFMNEVCYGLDLRNYDVELLRKKKQINLQWLMDLYKASPYKEKFFDSKLSKQMGVIEKLTGSALFRQQIIEGKSEKEIRDSWEPGLSAYKVMRKKYLLYP